MTYLGINLMLAVVWLFLTADFSLLNLLVGYGVGLLGIALSRPVLGAERYLRAIVGVFRLARGFGWELLLANVQLARDILRRELPFRPGFIEFDIRDLGPTQTVFLANLVSLTPGTLTVDVDDAGDTLYVHSLHAQDPEAVRRSLRRLADLVHGAIGSKPTEEPP